MNYFTYTIYPPHNDPAPGRGRKPAQVGITFQPTPCLTALDVWRMADALRALAGEMDQLDRT